LLVEYVGRYSLLCNIVDILHLYIIPTKKVSILNILALVYAVPSMFINKLTNAVFWQTRDGGTNACVGKRKNKSQGNQIMLPKIIQCRHLRTPASSGSVSGFVWVSCQSEINRPIKIDCKSRSKKKKDLSCLYNY